MTTTDTKRKTNLPLLVITIVGGSLALGACQSSGKGSYSAPTNPFQAEQAFYQCMDDTNGRTVLATGGNRAVARRFIAMCSRELSDWEAALVANGMPEDVASQRIENARNALIDTIADNLSGPI